MDVSRTCDRALFFVYALVMERGNRSEAAAFVADMEADVQALTRARPRTVNRKVENLWQPGLDALEGLAWGWFAVTGVMSAAWLALVTEVVGPGLPEAVGLGFVLAPTTALAATRALGRQLLLRALKYRRMDKRTLPLVGRLLSDSASAPVALLAWCGWTVMLSL